MRRLTALGAAVVLLSTGCSSPDDAIPLGFSRASADRQRSLEQRLIERADAARVRDVHRELTRLPHPAGSSRDRELADWIAQQSPRRGTRRRSHHDPRGAAASSARSQRRDERAVLLARGDARKADGAPGRPVLRPARCCLITHSPRRARSRRRSSTRVRAHPRLTNGWRGAASTSKAASSSCIPPEPIDIAGWPHLLRSSSARPRC